MSSIFDLKTDTKELSGSNQGTARMQYDQHPPTRDVTSTNFPNGAIHMRCKSLGRNGGYQTVRIFGCVVNCLVVIIHNLN